MSDLAAYDDTSNLRWYRLAGDEPERFPDSGDTSEADDDDFEDDDEDPDDADEDELEENPDDK